MQDSVSLSVKWRVINVYIDLNYFNFYFYPLLGQNHQDQNSISLFLFPKSDIAYMYVLKDKKVFVHWLIAQVLNMLKKKTKARHDNTN